MDRTRVYRWLRISASATCLVLCGLLIVLWVRSYKTKDDLFVRWYGLHNIRISSTIGRFVVRTGMENVSGRIGLRSYIPKRKSFVDGSGRIDSDLWIRAKRNPIGGVEIIVPQWFSVILFATLGTIAATPWLRWSIRFSLRTMLIVTTVVAVVLGILVGMSRLSG